MNERRKPHQALPARHPDAEAQTVGEQGAVGVAPVWEVDNTQQLGEEDHVDQVRAESPDNSTGVSRESKSRPTLSKSV